MLAVALRRRGAIWLAQLAPAMGRSHALSMPGASMASHGSQGTAGQRAIAWAAANTSSGVQSTSNVTAVEASMDEGPAKRKRGRPRAPGPTVLLVESPAKAKKIQQLLGSNYTVLASYGHIRDLPPRKGSVDPDADFSMKWQVLSGAEDRLPSIIGAVKSATRLVLATDPDREGEAISWHLLQELEARKAIRKSTPTERITFTEVTKQAVLQALQQPRGISEPLVDAYLARRALDYLFGFHLSPLLWRKVAGARSAGRVQSVALRLVCEREAAIDAFQQQQYYTVEAALQLPGGSSLEARLASVDGMPPPQPGFVDKQQADAVAARVAGADFTVQEASNKEQHRQPPAPFTTSTLQQEASKRLGLGASRTMQLAQQLYESGHITYMRTDGVRLAPTAVAALREAAQAEYGSQYVPAEPRMYKARSKNAQEAHEAIRPTDPRLTPENLLAQGVERQAAKLYGLIRSRALACQMSSARINQVAADLASSDGSLQLRATASSIAFPGFLAAYYDASAASFAAGATSSGAAAEAEAEEEEEEEGQASASLQRRAQVEAAKAAAAMALASLQHDHAVVVRDAAASAHETRPPPRFTEGSLVKRLEELGIGRPSTYAPTINVLQKRGYIRKEGRALHAEALGRVLTAFLQQYFPRYVDYGFTSGLEDQLDDVSAGSTDWRDVLRGFWGPFSTTLDAVAGVPMTEVIDRLNEAVGTHLIGENRVCPSCGGQLSIKFTSRVAQAPFVGCSQYPSCKFARSITANWEVEAGATDGEQGNNAQADRQEATEGVSGYARLLGADPGTGMPVYIRSGLYGPYVQRGSKEDEPGFRRQALSKTLSSRGVSLQEALSMLALPKDLGPNPATGESVLVAMGKFGPFIRCGAMSRAIPQGYDALKMTLADALQLLATKTAYTTGRASRNRIIEAVDAADSASGRSDPAATSAATKDSVGGATGSKRKTGRGRKLDVSAEEEAAVAQSRRLAPGEASSEAQSALLARREARLALEAAAQVEVDQLQAALGHPEDPSGSAPEAGTPASKGKPTSAYTLFYQRTAQEAQRTGNKWWQGQSFAAAIAARWASLSAEERQVYEEEAAEARLEVLAQKFKLLRPGQPLSSLSPSERSAVGAAVALHRAEATIDQTHRNHVALPRPRTAYNLFTAAYAERTRQELGPGKSGGDVLMRLAERWRAATVLEKGEFKLKAEEDAKAYKEARALLGQKQRAATAAALAAGMDTVAAARAGLLAGQRVIDEHLQQRKQRLLREKAERSGGEGT